MKISTRLILLLVTAVIGVMAVYALVTISRTQDRLSEELLKMGEHISMALSVGVLHHLDHGDLEGAKGVLESISRYEDVIGAAVFDRQGRLMVATQSMAAALQDSTQVYTALVGEGRDAGERDGERIYTYRMALRADDGQLVGSLRLVLGGRSLLRYVFEARNFILATIVVLTLVLSVLIVFFSQRQIAEPLQKLTTGAEAVGRGELDHRIAIEEKGEFATLAAAFNQMAANLEATNREIVAEREYIRNIVNSIAEGIVVLDTQGRITVWNRTMEQRHGMSLSAVLGKPFLELFPALCAHGFGRVFRRLLQDEIGEFTLQKLRLENSSERIVKVSGSPLRDDRSRVAGGVLVLSDLTGRLRMEEQIQQSEKLAAVGQLAAGMAHEIGTPLNVISGSAEYLLMDMEKGDEHREELQTIIAETGRIAELVKQLMAFARPEAPGEERLDIGKLIEPLLVLLRRQIEKQGIRIAVDVGEGLFAIKGDRGQIHQVLLNLIMNAWQAMPEGGRLGIGARNAPGGRTGAQEVEIQIEDTGVGIAEAHLARIFDPFFTTKEVGRGTGLGLAVSSRIVERHGGRIEVSSREGKGSTFTVVLPALGGESHDG